jgi:protein TonB
MAKQRFLALLAMFFLVHLAGAQTEPAQQPKKVRVSSGLAEKNKTYDVAPKYPKEARERGIQGVVLLGATIDAKGNIADLKVLQGDPILAEASIDSVKKWKYRPYLLNGEPVEVVTTIKVQFHM